MSLPGLGEGPISCWGQLRGCVGTVGFIVIMGWGEALRGKKGDVVLEQMGLSLLMERFAASVAAAALRSDAAMTRLQCGFQSGFQWFPKPAGPSLEERKKTAPHSQAACLPETTPLPEDSCCSSAKETPARGPASRRCSQGQGSQARGGCEDAPNLPFRNGKTGKKV